MPPSLPKEKGAAYRYLDHRFWERVGGVWTEVNRLRMRWLVAHHRESGRTLPVGSDAEAEHYRLFCEAAQAMSAWRAENPHTGRELIELFSTMPTPQLEAAMAAHKGG
jgi:hypothetical protein